MSPENAEWIETDCYLDIDIFHQKVVSCQNAAQTAQLKSSRHAPRVISYPAAAGEGLLYEWHWHIQQMVDWIDECVRRGDDEALTLGALSRGLGYSLWHTARRFRALSGMTLRHYLRMRRLAYALLAVRDTRRPLLEIALDHGFASHEAFSRSFKAAYGLSPSAYRKNPLPVVLRTKISAFDRYILGIGEIGMMKSDERIKIYFVSIPAHKFLHIKNYESDGYFDFWAKQAAAPGQDCDAVCGLLDSVRGKLDGNDGEIGTFSGQIMARLFEADGRRPEAYGVRLPPDYAGVPAPMLMLDVPDGEYVVFEHGPFDYEQQNESAFEKLEEAVGAFSFANTGYALSEVAGRVSYYFHDPSRYMKRVLPVVRI